MNAPARKMEIPSDMETYATVYMTATMDVFTSYGLRMLSRNEVAEQPRIYFAN